MKRFLVCFAVFAAMFFVIGCGGGDSSLSRCSPTSSTPCIDNETYIIWSGKSSKLMHWSEAVDYCENLDEGGYSDWELPYIAILKTLVCNTLSCWGDSKFGENDFLWSHTHSGSSAEGVYFYNGKTESKSVDELFYARCFRIEKRSRRAECHGLPKNAEWNTVSSIDQTWNNFDSWTPNNKGGFNESPSSTECRFKCKTNYTWDGSECANPCDPNPCKRVAHSTDVCTKIDLTSYSCGCDNGYYWYGLECIDPNNPRVCNSVSDAPCEALHDHNWYIWSPRASNKMTWSEAVDYCWHYSEFGVSDWRLPNIDELKSLNNCSSSYSCDVSEPNHLSSDDWNKNRCRCNEHSYSFYHELGDDSEQWLWSSSIQSDNPNNAFYIDFTDGGIYSQRTSDHDYVRCVRDKKY